MPTTKNQNIVMRKEARKITAVGLLACSFLLAGGVRLVGAEAKEETSKATNSANATTPILVKAVTVKAPPKTIEIDVPGRLISAQRKELSFQVGGLIESLPAETGQRVKKGDLLAQLESSRFRKNVEKAKAALSKAEAAEADALADYKRIRGLWAEGDVSKESLQKSAALSKSAKQDVEIAREEVALAELDLGYATLVAPTDGVIEAVPPDAHETVAAGETIAVMTDPGQLRFKVHLAPDMARRTKDFSGYECVFPTLGGLSVPAQLYSLGPSAVEPLKAIPLKVELTSVPQDARLVPGRAGLLRITVTNDTASNHLLIPANALVADTKGRKQVWVVDPKTKKAEKKAVKTDGLRKGMVEVTSGLQPGDQVITAGQSTLSPGRLLRVASKTGNDQ